MSPWPYSLAYVVPLSVITGHMLGGFFYYLTPMMTFGLIPLLDVMIGPDRTNLNAESLERLSKKIGFRVITFLYVPLQIGLVIWGAYVVTHEALTGLELAGFVLSLGIATGGVGITVAHELFHKKNAFEKTLGHALLMTVSYMHFYIEHLIGHHVHVATPRDPATARRGESLYAFYVRTVSHGWLDAWRIEMQRLQHRGYSRWGYHNRMLWFAALPAFFAAMLGGLFGWQAVLYFFAQSAVGFSLLEIVNYLEHYGLQRRELSPGRYEKVNMRHAWNADQRVTNYFLFKLQRHADHHVHPLRRYQALRHFEESPQLPTGYPGMVLLALVPPLWRKIMHPRLDHHQQTASRTAPSLKV